MRGDRDTYSTRNNCTIANAIKLRRLDYSVKRVVLISPVVELQMALQCATSISFREFYRRLIAGFPAAAKKIMTREREREIGRELLIWESRDVLSHM
jgi:hypothetical protein